VEDVVNPWQGRRVFLTGHTGFKGSWLALWLARKGARIRGFALDPSTAAKYVYGSKRRRCSRRHSRRCEGLPQSRSSNDRICPRGCFSPGSTAACPSLVCRPSGHLRNQRHGHRPSPGGGQKDFKRAGGRLCNDRQGLPESRMGLALSRDGSAGRIRPVCIEQGLRRNCERGLSRLIFPAGPHPGAPCRCLATARAGKCHWRRGLVGRSADSRPDPRVSSQKPVLIRRPNAIRPWQHVLESLRGYMTLAEQLLAERVQFASSFNFGPGDEDAWPVDRIATKLASSWGDGASWKCDGGPSPHENRILRLDASKARTELGWQPRLRIEPTLEWTLDWYRAWERGDSMQLVTQAQIAAYEHLIQ
jgi:CDP-glucose 4,6-dehydratase